MKKCLSVILCVVSPFLFNSAIALSGTSFPYTATTAGCQQKSLSADDQQQASMNQSADVALELCQATPTFLEALKEFQESKKTPNDIKNFKTTAKNAVIDKFFDMAGFAKPVLKYTWTQGNSSEKVVSDLDLKQQQEDFSDALLDYIVMQYVKNLEQYTVSKVEFLPVVVEDGVTKIKSKVFYQKDGETKDLNVGYTLNSSGKITDVTVLIDSTPLKFETLLTGALANHTHTLVDATEALKKQTSDMEKNAK